MREYYVYIMTNVSKTLYVGVTNNLERRVIEHKSKTNPGFTKKYNVNRLVYFEAIRDCITAIKREKQIKGWKRNKKLEIINSINPFWVDLSAGWF